jgi:hypothetical protein
MTALPWLLWLPTAPLRYNIFRTAAVDLSTVKVEGPTEVTPSAAMGPFWDAD